MPAEGLDAEAETALTTHAITDAVTHDGRISSYSMESLGWGSDTRRALGPRLPRRGTSGREVPGCGTSAGGAGWPPPCFRSPREAGESFDGLRCVLDLQRVDAQAELVLLRPLPLQLRLRLRLPPGRLAPLPRRFRLHRTTTPTPPHTPRTEQRQTCRGQQGWVAAEWPC